jgi:hypothetical protein
MTAYAPPVDVDGVKSSILKKWLGVLLWDLVVSTEDKAETLAASQATNRHYHEWIARLRGQEPPQWTGATTSAGTVEDDEMSVHIGDIYQNIEAPGSPSAVVAGKAGVKLAQSKPSRLKRLLGIACVAAALLAAPSAYAELSALFSAVAEIKVLWDGQEIKPGESASGGAANTSH